MKKIVNTLLILSIVLSPIVYKGAVVDNSDLQAQQLNVSEYESSAPYKVEAIELDEEKSIEDLMESKGISDEETKKIYNKNTMEYSLVGKPNTETRYTTEKRHFKLNNDVSIIISVKVKYIHNNDTDENQIISVEEPCVDVDGANLYRWSGTVSNKEVNDNSVRISIICQPLIEVDNNISNSFDLSGLTFAFSTDHSKIYTTEDIKTFVIKIKAKDL